MTRRLLNVLTSLSLLLCVAVAAIWKPSFRSSHHACWVRQDATGRLTSTDVMVSRGILRASTLRWVPSARHHYNSFERPGVHYYFDLQWRFPLNGLGFGAGRNVSPVEGGACDWAAVPLWLVAVMVAALPAAHVAAWARRPVPQARQRPLPLLRV
jgi:hypothetical protein